MPANGSRENGSREKGKHPVLATWLIRLFTLITKSGSDMGKFFSWFQE